MKVVYFPLSSVVTGGGSVAFLNMLYACRKRGIEPMVICPSYGDLYSELINNDVKTVVIPYYPSTYPPFENMYDVLRFFPRLCKRMVYNLYAVCKITTETRKFQPNMIHTNVSITNVGYRVAHRLGIPHIWHIREYGDMTGDYWIPSRTNQLKKYREVGSYTICVTHGIQEEYSLCACNNSCVVYDAVKTIYPPYNKGEKSYFLFVGRVECNKGVIPMLQAYALYCQEVERPLPLYIVGHYNDDDYYRRCLDFIKGYHLSDKVLLVGEQKDVSSYYREAAAVVVPSKAEGFGLVVAEAMSARCLVIGHNTTGIREQLDNGFATVGREIGLRYDTIPELKDCFLNVSCASPNAFDEMKRDAQMVVRQLYSIDTCADNIMNFYKYIACGTNDNGMK